MDGSGGEDAPRWGHLGAERGVEADDADGSDEHRGDAADEREDSDAVDRGPDDADVADVTGVGWDDGPDDADLDDPDLSDLSWDAEPAKTELPDFETALKILTDPAEPLQPGLVHALSDPRVSEVRVFADVWHEIESERRLWIARRLMEAAEASFQVRFERLFRILLGDEEAEVRSIAIDGLWEADDPKLIERYVALLGSDPNTDVRARAAAALGDYVYRGELDEIESSAFESALGAVVDAAGDESEDPFVRRRALESAGYADRAVVRGLIEEHLESVDRDLRIGAVCAMGRSVDERWEDAVVATLEDPDAAIRYEAALASGKLAIESAVPGLIELLDESDREIQLAAIWSLGEIGGRRARRALESLTGASDDEDVIEAVEDALGMVALSDGEMPWGILGDPTGELEHGNGHYRTNGDPGDDEDFDD